MLLNKCGLNYSEFKVFLEKQRLSVIKIADAAIKLEIRVVASLSRMLMICNELGLHARAAARIAEVAQKARAGIWVSKGGERADATSIIDILTLAGEKGSRIILTVDDPADIELLNNIADLVENGFGE